jgi:3-hydroxybutyryl-CoA dehydrogenase
MELQNSTVNGTPLEPGSYVVVAGGGLVGAQIALEYALAGYATRMVNRSEQSGIAALERSRQAPAVLVAEGLIADELGQAGMSRLTASADLAESCRGASLVIESIVEDLGAKLELLSQIDALAPAAIIATNTSSLSISEMGRRSATARRLAGTHYWNPLIGIRPR